MRGILALLVAGTGCIEAHIIDCGNGVACPAQLVCDLAHSSCTTQPQLDACDGEAQDTPCIAHDVDHGRCREGVCLSTSCGDGYRDPDEMCDDGNQNNFDGCRADCQSDEHCGGGVVDPGEECDDGNLTSHDGCDSQCRTEVASWRQDLQIATPAFANAAAAYDDLRHELVVLGGGITAIGPAVTYLWDGTAWRQLDPLARHPSARRKGAMAYDTRRHEMILFGGLGATGELGDTWIWDGERWTEHVGPAPTPRHGHTMVYDPDRDRVVLFGGTQGDALADVWEWSGTTWSKIDQTEPAPSARTDHAAAWDPVRHQSVIYGGTNGSSASTETWLWDGHWSRGEDGPVPATEAAMSFSPVLRAVIATVGGQWFTWDGTHWSTPVAAPAAARRAHASFFDVTRSSTMIAGGAGDATIMTTAWALADGTVAPTWTAVGSSVPPLCAVPALEYDSTRATSVMFDGMCIDFHQQTWELAGATWRRRIPTPPAPNTPAIVPPQRPAASTFDSLRGETLVYPGTADGAVFGWDGDRWVKHTPTGSVPDSRASTAMVFDRVRGVALLVGGNAGLNDTWLWDGTTWRRLDAGPRRYGHHLTYDSRRHKIVLFGGQDETSAGVNDVWEWDGTWTRIPATLPAPSPRSYFGMAFDERLGETIVFGGDTIDTHAPLRDLWAWNGTRWRELTAANTPDVPHAISMVYDTSRASLVAVGYDMGFWRLRWESPTGRSEVCKSTVDLDLDGDGLAGCADPDCDWACE